MPGLGLLTISESPDQNKLNPFLFTSPFPHASRSFLESRWSHRLSSNLYKLSMTSSSVRPSNSTQPSSGNKSNTQVSRCVGKEGD